MLIASADRMRKLDAEAVDAGSSVASLMERAGAAVFDQIVRRNPRSISIVCGKGNNGGDGFVVAKMAQWEDLAVTCFVVSDGNLGRDAQAALDDAVSVDLDPVFVADGRIDLTGFDLVIDALLGTGAKGDVRGGIREAIESINRSGRPVFSIDVPSGIDADTGRSLGTHVRADSTVTFGYPKPFLFLGEGPDASGSWTVADIGLPKLDEADAFARLIQVDWVSRNLPRRKPNSNKGDHGKVAVIAGSDRMRGAATLSAHAALRAGSGLVTVASLRPVCDAVANHLPEAMLMPMDAWDLDIAMDVLSRSDAGLFGPGLGTDPEVEELLANVFQRWDRPALVDADALNLVAKGVPLPSGPAVLTPHPGEAARLLGCSIEQIEEDRFASARELADRFQKTCVLKGRHSIIASPGRLSDVNISGNAGLATGGSGDTLSGVIASLLGQGLDTHTAACCGVFWHGFAADLCSNRLGSVGYLPSDVSMALPNARDTILQK